MSSIESSISPSRLSSLFFPFFTFGDDDVGDDIDGNYNDVNHEDDVDDDDDDDDDDNGLIALHLLLNVIVDETADVREDIRNLVMIMMFLG